MIGRGAKRPAIAATAPVGIVAVSGSGSSA
jgi:hypothetical protein